MIDEVVSDDARLINISVGGAAIGHTVRPAIDSGIIVYIENLDRFEGRVVRLFRRGFGIQFDMGDRKRQRLADAIEAMSNGAPKPTAAHERRGVKRVSGEGDSILCRLDNGDTVECEIIDCSVANASLRCAARPFLGSEVRIGQSRARVIRHTKDGFAVEFADYWNARPPADSYVIYD